ncbi:hypothetical protein C8Q77DRAFT_4676 [Trametes polyzona]|nr:hypothetical protein C8Q77DRAFT_4676 [Trametes polyzona]
MFNRAQNLRENKTMLFSSPRFGKLMRKVDLIIHIENVVIIELCTHEDLLKQGSKYAKTRTLQAEALLSTLLEGAMIADTSHESGRRTTQIGIMRIASKESKQCMYLLPPRMARRRWRKAQSIRVVPYTMHILPGSTGERP